MVSVITGDIINSSKSPTKKWLKVLKKELSKLGSSPTHWDIYRGDSFQAEVRSPADGLAVLIQIKAAVKSQKGVDVRMAMGIGEKAHRAKSITESNGSAFIHSGQLLEELKSLKVNMAVRSDNARFNDEINLYLKLALVIMNGWTTNAAETIHAALEYPDKSQEALGKLLKIKQNAVSTRLKRACYYEIKEVIEMYRSKVAELK
jgi:hypothetical protein